MDRIVSPEDDLPQMIKAEKAAEREDKQEKKELAGSERYSISPRAKGLPLDQGDVRAHRSLTISSAWDRCQGREFKAVQGGTG